MVVKNLSNLRLQQSVQGLQRESLVKQPFSIAYKLKNITPHGHVIYDV